MTLVIPLKRVCVCIAILVLLAAIPEGTAITLQDQSGALEGASADNTAKVDDAGVAMDFGLSSSLKQIDLRDTATQREPDVKRLALWEQLNNLTPEQRANAEIELELASDASSFDQDAVMAITTRWHDGQYDVAIDQLKSLEQTSQLVGLGIAWKVPSSASELRALDNRIGGIRTEAQNMNIDFDAQNGNLFAVIRWGTTSGTSAWTMNISEDNGLTWAESYSFSSSVGLIDVDCAVADDYVYVAYVAGNAPDEARLRRCTVNTGGIDGTFGFQTVFDAGTNTVEEVALASNADDFDNRIYYTIIQSNDVLRFAYDTSSDGSTFVENSPASSNPEFGLDATWDNDRSDCSGYLFVSYSGADGDIHVLSRSETTWTDWSVESSAGSYRTTAISAYQNTIICAFEYPYASGTGIRYQISYNCGDSWSPGSLAIPDGTTIFGYFEPDVDARDGDGTAIIYQAEAGEFDPMYYRTRNGFEPGPWTDPAIFSDYDVYTGSDTAMGYLPPIAGEAFSHGAIFLSLDPDFRTPYFDRPTAAGPFMGDVTPPLVSIGSPEAIDCACGTINITGTVDDPEGTYVSDRLEYRRRGTSTWNEVASQSAPRTGTLYSWNTTGLAEDYYFLRIVAQNESGLENSDTTFIYKPTGFDTVELSLPKDGDVCGGNICIQGTAWTEACFKQYTVSYRPSGGASWIPVDPANTVYKYSVINGLLANCDTTNLGLADGDYDLQLLGETECGHTASQIISVVIDNEPPTAVLSEPVNCDAFLPGSGVDIYGEIFDENLDEWTLSIIGGPFADWQTIAGPSSTNASGFLTNWDTTGLPACSYTIRLQASDTSIVDCGPNPNITETFSPHDFAVFTTLKLNGTVTPAVIGGVIWEDYNGDGIQNVGEPGIANVTLDLIDTSGPTVVDTQTTDTNGLYQFQGLPAGNYEVGVTDTNAVLSGLTLTGGTDPHAVSLAVGQIYNDADFGFSDLDSPLDVAFQSHVTAQGLLPVQCQAFLYDENPPVTFEWEILTTGEVFTSQDNPFVFDDILDASNGNLEFQVSVWDSMDGPITDSCWILIAADPAFYDLNGDGCNTLDDWRFFIESWNQEAYDPNGDGRVDVRDFLYLNTSGDCQTRSHLR